MQANTSETVRDRLVATLRDTFTREEAAFDETTLSVVVSMIDNVVGVTRGACIAAIDMQRGARAWSTHERLGLRWADVAVRGVDPDACVWRLIDDCTSGDLMIDEA